MRRDADRRPRRIFITGASSGIGAALVRHYAQGDVLLGLVGRRRDTLEALAAECDGKAQVFVADVADAAAMQTAAAQFVASVGVPDIVIASAGVSVGTLTEYAEDADAFARVMQTNVLGMLHTFQPFVAPMRASGAGTLVGIASVAGVRGLPGAGAYSASKAAVRRYLESLRVELHGSGVRVVTISPGYIDTPMTAVNTYPMPFLLPANVAAKRMANAIDAGRRHVVIPWQMGLVAWVLGWLPDPVYDRIFARAGRKPRGLPL
ncbi:SDR family oxidoreductase [Denitromonas ohlonensis]|uniref:SDR family oxidoreductase n=2 Tax=Denitromonas TaxID=139331 RepID=A0A558EE90_9RHOO|nr:SDR family oxidoreductase [Denitromonas ohlonensis]TVO64908.1 SDR family oxidoreductase [Denitromonas ohlonensis]TVO75581.1 SDR family oxidoreductase [Denitromonas ohlonensis]TVT47339.1 MAG: SDR family oxidoreductase [Denitromonas halophila]TVT71691.1 MAG: SDR family oxidoreductase [Denitromonas halophila]